MGKYAQVTYDSTTRAEIGMSPGFDTPEELIGFLQESEGITYPIPDTRHTTKDLGI